VNVFIVTVLAGITWWYARSAKYQADAAKAQAEASEAQAKAATKQAEVAARTLSVMQAQIQEQAGIGTAVLKQCIAELQESANHWAERFVSWGDIVQGVEVELLPAQWSVAMQHAFRTLSGDIVGGLTALQTLARQTELAGAAILSKRPIDRSLSKAGELQRNLDQIQRDCQTILTKTNAVI
jgi:hypothetical protein